MNSLFKSIAMLVFILFFGIKIKSTQLFITTEKSSETILLKDKLTKISFYSDKGIDKGILRAIHNLQADFQKVTGDFPNLLNQISTSQSPLIIIGTFGTNSVIDELIKKKKINENELKGKREKFIIQNIKDFNGVSEMIVIAGSDKRGTIYGIYEFSKQIGVSPWYYWADVHVKQKENLYFKKGIYTDDEPAVEYRGIFLNDEEPSLGSWARATFGGINSPIKRKLYLACNVGKSFL